MRHHSQKSGFTLIELLVVIAIIGILSSVVLASLGSARIKSRDTRRLVDMSEIQKALEFYFDTWGFYPVQESGNGNWEDSNEDGGDFIDVLLDEGYMSNVPVDPINSSVYRYSFFRYNAGSYGCNASNGRFIILGVRDMETSGRPHPASPGFSCPNRDWQSEFDWVIGKFEN